MARLGAGPAVADAGGEQGPLRVRVAFDRLVLLDVPVGADGPVPVVDGVTGQALVGVGLLVRFGRVFESAGGGCYPREADELNGLLRVSFDHVHGLRFWPGEGLGCGWDVMGWLTVMPVRGRGLVSLPASRDEVEGLMERHWDLLVEDECLESRGYHVSPVGEPDLLELMAEGAGGLPAAPAGLPGAGVREVLEAVRTGPGGPARALGVAGENGGGR